MKVYLANQTGSVTGLMDRALRWLPAMMSDDPYNSLVQISDSEKDHGPLATQAEGYILDLKDPCSTVSNTSTTLFRAVLTVRFRSLPRR